MKHAYPVALVALVALVGCKSAPDAEPTAQAAEQPETAAEVAGQPESKGTSAIVINDADAERRTAPSGKAQITKLVTGENAFVGKLEMQGGGKVPVHRDATEEYIYILEGSGKMTIDGKVYDVGPNTAIYMPANAEVSFEGGPDKLVALQVFAGPEPSAKYDAWTPKAP